MNYKPKSSKKDIAPNGKEAMMKSEEMESSFVSSSSSSDDDYLDEEHKTSHPE